jgi:hypothetical protein
MEIKSAGFVAAKSSVMESGSLQTREIAPKTRRYSVFRALGIPAIK